MNGETEKTTNYIGHYVVLNMLIERAKQAKKIDELERYIDMYIEVYINTIGGGLNE